MAAVFFWGHVGLAWPFLLILMPIETPAARRIREAIMRCGSFARTWLLKGLLCMLVLAFNAGSVYGAWQLVWSDEFNGTSIASTNWTFETGNNNGWGNSEREYYTSRTNNAYVANGVLHIVAQQESFGGFPFTSARMKTQNLFSKLYGRIEFRAKLPHGLGYWPALWMLGTNIPSVGWPWCGEVDVMECQGSWNSQVQGTIHYANTNGNDLSQTKVYPLPVSGDSVTNFHTYAIEWTTNSIKWLIDSNTVQTWTTWGAPSGPYSYPVPFNRPFFLIMNVAVGGSYLGYPSDSTITNNTVFPGEMQVDYVRVYDSVPAVPDAPTGLVAGAGNGKAYLTWDASTSGATGYNVKRATNSGGPYMLLASTAANSYVDANLSSCANYYYVVSGTNSLGEGSNSTEAAVSLGTFSLAVNSGGSGVAQFIADTYVAGGAQATPSTATIDTSAVLAPAPQAVYQTERYGNFTYTFTGLTAGLTYKVRLHFAEFYWTSAGQRVFNVSINGRNVLTNYDIVATAGAANRANIQEFTTIPTSTNTIVVQYTTVVDNAKSSGIEVLLPKPAAPAGLAANAGDSMVALNWNSAFAATGYNLKRSLVSAGPYSTLVNGLTGTNYVDPGLTNGTTYFYEVSAVNAGCESTNSAPVSATPVCSPPATPVAGNNGPIWAGKTLNLTASTVSGASYRWTGPNGFLSTDQNPSIPSATTNASGVYSVAATTGSCSSPAGTTVVAINPLPMLSVQAVSGNLMLSWPAGAGSLQMATDISGPWSDVSNSANPLPVQTTQPQQFSRLKLQ